jgi:hypothetical protein
MYRSRQGLVAGASEPPARELSSVFLKRHFIENKKLAKIFA